MVLTSGTGSTTARKRQVSPKWLIVVLAAVLVVAGLLSAAAGAMSRLNGNRVILTVGPIVVQPAELLAGALSLIVAGCLAAVLA